MTIQPCFACMPVIRLPSFDAAEEQARARNLLKLYGIFVYSDEDSSLLILSNKSLSSTPR